MSKRKEGAEVFLYGVTPNDLKRFIERLRRKVAGERNLHLWTEELDKKYTSKPRYLVKNGKKGQKT